MNAEKRTALVDLTECSGFPVLLEVLDDLVKLEESKLLKYDLRDGNSNTLLITKCEADGARKLAYSLQKYLKTLRGAALKAND
jgi:hypothetical protein